MSFVLKLEKKLLTLSGLKSLSIQLDITNSCNLSCSHCYHADHNNRGNLSLDDWSTVLDQYENLLDTLGAKPNIAICGGEPLTSRHLVPLLEKITQRWRGTFVGIMTNGTQIEKKIELLTPFPLFFQVSLESWNSQQHDEIRGKGTFRSAVNGIKLLRQKGFDTNGLVILSQRTALEINQMFDLAKSIGLNSLNYTRAIPAGAGKPYFEAKDSPLVGNSLRDALVLILSASKRSGIRTNMDKPLFNLIDTQAGVGGKSGYQGLVVGYRGEIKASSRSGIVLGNIRSSNLEDVYFENDLYRSLRRGEILKCGECKFFARCGGDRNYAYATTGNFLGPDNGCWLY